MTSNSLYETLEIRSDASLEVIKAAYRTLSAKFHPDRDSSAESSRRFMEIQHAYEVLSDEARRRDYDRILGAGSVREVESVVVLRIDGTSTFLTLREHQRRGWQEAAGCDLSNHDFSGLSFDDAKLMGAKLDGSRFVGCSFRRADLTGCVAKGCQFDRADFSGAKLVDSDCTRSSFQQTDLRDCEISRCNLLSTNLIDANLTGCCYSDETRFPDGYRTPLRARNLDEERRVYEVEVSHIRSVNNLALFVFYLVLAILVYSLIQLIFESYR